MTDRVTLGGDHPEAPAVPPAAEPEEGKVAAEFRNEDGSVNVEALYDAYRQKVGEEVEAPAASTPEAAEEGAEAETGAAEGGSEETPKLPNDADRFSDENISRWAEEYRDTGAISDETLKEIGLPRNVVEAFIRGQEATAASATNSVLEAVGGEEGFAAIAEWSQTALSQAERDAANAILAGSDPEAARQTLLGLQARMKAASPPSRVVGGNGGNKGSQGDLFTSHDQLKDAQRDPRYATSEAYRQEVLRKAAGLLNR